MDPVAAKYIGAGIAWGLPKTVKPIGVEVGRSSFQASPFFDRAILEAAESAVAGAATRSERRASATPPRSRTGPGVPRRWRRTGPSSRRMDQISLAGPATRARRSPRTMGVLDVPT